LIGRILQRGPDNQDTRLGDILPLDIILTTILVEKRQHFSLYFGAIQHPDENLTS
jgi:hypothetical protein